MIQWFISRSQHKIMCGVFSHTYHSKVEVFSPLTAPLGFVVQRVTLSKPAEKMSGQSRHFLQWRDGRLGLCWRSESKSRNPGEVLTQAWHADEASNASVELIISSQLHLQLFCDHTEHASQSEALWTADWRLLLRKQPQVKISIVGGLLLLRLKWRTRKYYNVQILGCVFLSCSLLSWYSWVIILCVL